MKHIKTFPIYNIKDVCEMLGVSRPTLWRYMKTGLQYRKVGKYVRFLDKDIRKFLDSKLVTTSPS